MREPIEINYVPDGDDWHVTASGRGQTLTATAPGLVAARNRADQLAEELAPDEEHRRVVHLLNGDALAFTSAYLSASLAKPTEMPSAMPAETAAEAPEPDEPAVTPAVTPAVAPAEVPAPAPSAEQARQASTS